MSEFFYKVKDEVIKKVKKDYFEITLSHDAILDKYGIEKNEYNSMLHGRALIEMIAQNVTVREFEKQKLAQGV
jgi:alanyl-tRNA synthetase